MITRGTSQGIHGRDPAHFAMTRGYSELRDQLVRAADGVDYAYRDTGGRASGVHRVHHRLQFGPVDLLGFSIGSFAAQQIAPIRPAIVRKPTTTRTRGAAPGGDGATIGLL